MDRGGEPSFEQLWAPNMLGVFQMIRELAPHMKEGAQLAVVRSAYHARCRVSGSVCCRATMRKLFIHLLLDGALGLCLPALAFTRS